jgi:DNA sulfur modification protein DndE
MIRFKIDSESTEMLDKITNKYNFKKDTITSRIAFSLSLSKGILFHPDTNALPQNGREYTPTSNIFGSFVNNSDNFIIYKTILDQHYSKELTESEFIKLYKLHLKDGLELWQSELINCNITEGGHIKYLLNKIEYGLQLRSNIINTNANKKDFTKTFEYTQLLTFELGELGNGEIIKININDLREFDNRNIAIAGMAGSGKTQFVKDILYQISKNTSNQLKFIFFDYKGEGNRTQLQPFLDATNTQFIDIVNDNGLKFNPLLSINLEPRQRPFSIKAFADTISMFVPSVGVAQKNILTNVLTDLFDSKNGTYPNVDELFESLVDFYVNTNRVPDTLYAGIQDLTTNIFNCSPDNPSILDNSLYLNLPPAISDTLRQLIVFLLLRYIYTHFSSTNDCEPIGYIFPLRYVIVIDEAHIYLRNKNARKALEELLRLLRSKGVIIIMLSQGVDDYKTKDFDFASQVKLPICLNIQNKDYKSITGFIGTPSSKLKLETEISKLESGIGLINIGEPKSIKLRQWWKTKQIENL